MPVEANKIEITLKELKVNNTTRVVARIAYSKDGKPTITNVFGQGDSRVDAVDALSKSKLAPALKGPLSAILSSLDPKAELPKAGELLVQPEADSKDAPEPVKDPEPQPDPEPEVTPEPGTQNNQTDSAPQTSTSEESTEEKPPAAKPPKAEKNKSKKPAGTKPAKGSSPANTDDDMKF